MHHCSQVLNWNIKALHGLRCSQLPYLCMPVCIYTHTHESTSLECTPVLYVHAQEPVSVCDCVFTARPCRYACLCSQPVPRGLMLLQTVLLALLTSCCSGQRENIAQRVFSRQSFAVSSLSWVTRVQIISQSVSILNKKRYSYQHFIFHMSGTYTCLYKEPFLCSGGSTFPQVSK